MKKLKPIVLRHQKPTESAFSKVKRNPIFFILDNIMDTYNIGSMFRLSDALAVEKLYICGEVEYPPSTRIHKAAVGTENWVPWEKRDSALEVAKELKKKNVTIIAIEQHKNSIPLSSLKNIITFPCALVLGHETEGISKNILSVADHIVELPMFGINNSFNVWGTGAVVGYSIVEQLPQNL